MRATSCISILPGSSTHAGAPVDISALRGPEFDRLKLAIESIGCNVQPIKVRSNAGPILPFNTRPETERQEFEVVFGYSRLLACMELGLPVIALAERLTELELAQQFASEFRSHSVWRPWRLGQFLRCTINGGLFASHRKAADALSMEVGEVSMVCSLAALPDVIRRLFGSMHLTPLQAKKLIGAYQCDPDGVTRNAGLFKPAKGETASSVLARLMECRK